MTSINLAHILATVHGKRVLLIDNDKQGNSSKFFGLHSYDEEKKTIADILLDSKIHIKDAIYTTDYENLDIIPANMNLLKANLQVILDPSRQQQTIIKKIIPQIYSDYDFCVIDNAPDINISIINALVISDDVIIPIKIDKFAFDGLDQLAEQVQNVKQSFNENLKIAGCLITQYQNNDVNVSGEEWLKTKSGYKVFNTHIRRTEKVDESSFASKPINDYSWR
jgi:chromosome partitioning protein